MNIKSLLLGSAAALVAATGAQAADAIVAPEPEAVEYVRVCDAYGAGYFYIPGTETCLRLAGYVRFDAKGGDDVYNGGKYGTWKTNTRFALRTYTATETELGTLKTFTENRFNFGNGAQGSHTLKHAIIQLGGLTVGKTDTAFQSFSGFLGDILNDDVVSPGKYDTNLISYTFTGGNGFSALISLEQGEKGGDAVYFTDAAQTILSPSNAKTAYSKAGFVYKGEYYDGVIDKYVPNVVGGLKFEQSWGSIALVAAYDAEIKEWAGKLRGDLKVTDAFSVWAQGGYASYSENVGMYGNWGGDWAVWGGAKFKATDKAVINVQGAYEDWGKQSYSANVAYTLTKGLVLTPEVTYTKWKNNLNYGDNAGKDAIGGMVRLQRSF